MSKLPLRRDADQSSTDSDVPAPTDYSARGVSLFDDGAEYAAVVVSAADCPGECTIFPLDVSEADLVTTWISAEEGAFVALDEMR